MIGLAFDTKLMAIVLLLLLANACVRPSHQKIAQRSQPTVSVEQLRRENAAGKVKRPQKQELTRVVCKYRLTNCRVPDDHN